jgi:hypothetical protein
MYALSYIQCFTAKYFTESLSKVFYTAGLQEKSNQSRSYLKSVFQEKSYQVGTVINSGPMNFQLYIYFDIKLFDIYRDSRIAGYAKKVDY